MQLYFYMLKPKFLSFLFLTFVLFAFCPANMTAQTTEKIPPTAQKSQQTTGRNPVIIIPGIQGSQLVNPQTGKTVWFNVRRDKDDDCVCR